MARNSSGSKNEPGYSGAGALSTAADLSEVASYAAFTGNHKVGPTTGTATGPGGANTGRTTSTGSDVWEGLTWEDTTDGNTYKYIGGSWVLWTSPIVTTGAVTARSGFTLVAGNTDLVKRNGFVTVQIDITKNGPTNFANADTFADLPTGFRPLKAVYPSASIFNVGVITPATVKINTDGSMVVFVSAGASVELTFLATFRHA